MSDTDQTESFEQARAGVPNVSPEMSVIWKPLERLFRDGTPISALTVLAYNIGGSRLLPFSSFTKTQNDRLIFWPPIDADEPVRCLSGDRFSIHHVTLELSSGKTHFTSFEADSERIHEHRGWRLTCFEDGLRLWLICAFQIELLEKQVGALEQSIKMPETDRERRLNEFRSVLAQMRFEEINAPPLRGDCFVTAFYIVPESPSRPILIKPEHFPVRSFWNNWIDGWPDDDKLQIAQTMVNVGGLNLLALTASPLGSLKQPCFVGCANVRPGSM